MIKSLHNLWPIVAPKTSSSLRHFAVFSGIYILVMLVFVVVFYNETEMVITIAHGIPKCSNLNVNRNYVSKVVMQVNCSEEAGMSDWNNVRAVHSYKNIKKRTIIIVCIVIWCVTVCLLYINILCI